MIYADFEDEEEPTFINIHAPMPGQNDIRQNIPAEDIIMEREDGTEITLLAFINQLARLLPRKKKDKSGAV